MSLTNFVPTVWADTLLNYLYKSLVFGSDTVCNRDYEGEITAFGNSVKINSIGAITVNDYVKDTDIAAAETLTSTQQSLNIDQAKYFNFEIDDLDKAQANPKVREDAMRNAAYEIRNQADAYLAAQMSAGVASGNILANSGSPFVPDLTNGTQAYDHLVDLGVVLDDSNTPDDGRRWVVVPNWFHGMLQKDQRFVGYGTPEQQDALRNGVVGTAAGFRVLKSNSVINTAGADYRVTAGHPMAASYAEQLVEMEAYRPPARFADAIKGLHVYGFKVTRPSNIAVLRVSKS